MFDQALLESRKIRALGHKRLSLPAAVALHAVVLGAFVGASAWFPGEPPGPAVPIVFPTETIPVSIGHVASGGETARVRRTGRADAGGPRLFAPVRVPDEVPSASSQDPTAESSLAESQPGEGSVTGPGNGEGPPGNEDGPPGPGDQILVPGGDVRAPVLLARIEPDYPEAARRAHLEGMVILEAVITAGGEVREIRVLKSVHPLLDEAAERAVKRWSYRPATLNGRAVPVYLTVTVTFGIVR